MVNSRITYIEPKDKFKKINMEIILKYEPIVVGIYCKLVTSSSGKTLSVKFLSKKLNISIERMRKTIVFLEKEGYITREALRDGNGHLSGWNYCLYAEPISQDKRTRAGMKKNDSKSKEKEKSPCEGFSRVKGSPCYGVSDNTEKPEDNIIIDNNDIYHNNIDIDNNIDIQSPVGDVGEVKKTRFVKPTVEEIAAYIKEKNYHFDAEQFFYYYESKGWMVGSNHMKNWKAACATWEVKRKKENNTPVQSEPEIPAADVEPWEKVQRWIKENTPTFADKVRYKDFTAMRGYAMFNAKTFADILIKMYESGYEGDIVSEFKRLFDEI